MLGAALKQLAFGASQYLQRRLYGTRSAQPGASHAGEPATLLRLDLGCGSAKRAGYLGIDRRAFEGVDGTTDLTQSQWLFDSPTLGGVQLVPTKAAGRRRYLLPENSVGEVICAHFLEHLEHNSSRPERVRFMNELWRVMVPGGRATIITPHWTSNRAYGDFTHADKPVSENFYAYLDRQWRETNAPDNDARYNPDGYRCDFSTEISFVMHPDLASKPVEEQRHAVRWYKEAALELSATMIARK